MKAQMLKLAGVKTEAAFYKKFPTQEAFMKVHGKAFKKAQIGTYIGGDKAPAMKPINFNDAYDAADLSITGKTNDMRKEEMYKQASLAADQKTASGGSGDMLSQIGSALGSLGEGFGGEAEYGAYIPKAQDGWFAKNNPYFMTNPGPINNNPQVTTGGPMGSNLTPVGQTIPNATMDKVGKAIGKYAGPVGQVLQGISALKAEKEAVRGARQTQQVSDLALQASKTRPEQTQRKYVRPEDMITAGNQVAPTQGTGTNILAQKGVTISGKPVNKKDVRKEKDVIKIIPNASLYPEEEANYVRTTKSLKGLGKRDKKIEQQATNDFIDWYQHPETLKRFGENTGMDPARLKDFVGKALRTPIRPAKEDDYLDPKDNAQWRSPFWQDQNYRTLNKDTGEIIYDSNATPNIIQHELGHASNLDELLGPKLMSILGKPSNVFREEKAYIGRPTEAYGNFHQFRTNLGLKPGQKIDKATLENLAKKKKLEGEMFYRAYSPDKIVKAINTIAYNPNADDNTTYAQDGAEIQNTYAPDTLYDDLGYEPLEDSTQIKKYQNGGVPWDIVGQAGSDIGGAIVGQDAGSQIGGTIGGTLGNAIGGPIGGAIGKTLGTVAGGLLDTNDKKLKRAQDATQRNMQGMAFANSAQGLQSQNAAYMEDGGYVSNDWNPQVIAKFGDHSPEDIYKFAHEGMKTLRAGGHLRAYRDPSEEAMESYAMGGELKTHWGGHMEEMSENPYLPDGGVTYMPHGQSHDEADGKGRTGIGITYGDNPVEVERREPIMKLRDGSTGEDNLVVFGNLEIPKYGVELLGDKKAKGMKFKNYVSDLSKSETKQNKTIQKSADELADLTPRTSFDKLKFAGLQANILGGNMKLKEIASTKEKAAALQNAINDTAEELGVDADSLAKGKVKTAKMGGQFTKAQFGKNIDKRLDKYKTDFGPNASDPNAIDLKEVIVTADPLSGKSKKSMFEHGDSFDYDKLKPYMTALDSVIPMLRPSDAESLDANQLYGEMYALSSNQEEPVQAQLYNPQLANSYRVSLADRKNEVTAQTRAAQRMAQGNPAIQAAIAAQAYEAYDKVGADEFRMNQELENQVRTANAATLNDAKLKNLAILDQQYTRQAQAKSNTKAIKQAALNSISDKYAKNKLENRTLKTYENMYNYRYDDNGRLINMNPLQQFNTSGILEKGSTKDLPEGYEYIYNKKGQPIDIKKATKEKAKNGSIVKAMRNL